MTRQPRYLMYTILVGKPDTYLPMFKLMWQSLGYSQQQFQTDFLLIGNRPCLRSVKQMMMTGHTDANRELAFKLPCVRKTYMHEVPVEPDLHDALLRKLDVVDFKHIGRYDQVLYLDCDIIVKGDLTDIFTRAARRPHLLHASIEYEDFNHPFFGFERYTPTQVGDMLKKGSSAFNNGTYMFNPKKSDILYHFDQIRIFARNNTYLRQRYYDQSFFNDYFNPLGLVSTRVLHGRVVIFPKPGKMYLKRKVLFVHFAGIQGYESKARRMEDYLQKLMTTLHTTG
jgi:hypothetical protein